MMQELKLELLCRKMAPVHSRESVKTRSISEGGRILEINTPESSRAVLVWVAPGAVSQWGELQTWPRSTKIVAFSFSVYFFDVISIVFFLFIQGTRIRLPRGNLYIYMS
jgi:hypothetical protein